MKQGLLFFVATLLLFSYAATAEPTITNAPNQIEGVYQIATWQDLLWISQNPEHWDKDFVQISDIDFSDAVPAITTWNNGKGWSPIGIASYDYETGSEFKDPFTGSYDGGRYAIKNLFISRLSEYSIGLFGFVREANIKNISLAQANITGEALVGGIGGMAESPQISHCFVSGSIQGSFFIGGILGLLMAGEIHESYNTATIAGIGGENGLVGGIVGAITDGHIVNTYNSGDISGAFFLGGLVGSVTEGAEESDVDPRITNSYSTGVLHKTEDEAFKSTKASKISHPLISGIDLSARHAKASSGVGGVIGNDDIGITTTNCFWDVDKDGIEGTASGDDNYGATGKTTEEMMNPETYAAFWAITEDDTIEKGYPLLAWELGGNAEKNNHVWIIGTSTDTTDPVAVPLSNTAIFLGFLLIGGFVIFRTYRIS